jgi:hypothetical protein
MVPAKGRITHKIVLPSYALSQFLHKAVFDQVTFSLFMENSAGTLKNNGIELDCCVTAEALMRLRFLVTRARDFVVKERISAAKFEELFGLTVVNVDLQDVAITVAVEVRAEAAVDVQYSEQNTESNRGSNTDFSSGTVNDSHTDHYSTTQFGGKESLPPEERFNRVPLLDALTVGTIIAKMDSQLKEQGSY